MRRLAILVAALAALVLPALATAHPLGNFTVNRFSGIELAGSEVYVRYALDLAEIPAYQLGSEARRPEYARELARGLELTLDGRRVPLRVLERRVTTSPGAGGLDTLRIDLVLRGRGAGKELRFEDRTLSGRIGWREVTLTARDGARILASSVPETSSSMALTAYPSEALRSPLDVSSARATVVLGGSPAPPPELATAPEPAGKEGGFEALIERGSASAGVLIVSLFLAAFWGAAHALTPGHGKALVAAYLVGTRGRPRDAFVLGGTVTLAHTAGVFALGFVTLGLSRFVVPERLYPWLTLVSGLLVVGVGATVLRSRLRSRPHDHHHDHRHPHDHDHHHHETPTSRGIVGVGIAAGLLPCPSALVVLLSAVALHRVGLGLALIVAFSVGLAATITAIGMVAVLARRTFSRITLDGPVVRALPAVSAALILAVGLAITVRALPGVV